MKVMNISKRKFQEFRPLDLPDGIFHNEAKIYIGSIKNGWSKITNNLAIFIEK